MEFYVKDIMSTDLITVRENTQIKDVIKTLSNNDISGVPVVDADGYLVGVVSFSDIINNESSLAFYQLPLSKDFDLELMHDIKFFNQPISAIMSEELYVIDPNASIALMSKEMYERKIHRLLVIEFEKLVGVVTTFDLLKLLASSDETMAA